MKEKKTWLYAVAKFIAPAVIGLPFGCRIIKGKNNIPESGRFAVCSNHISLLDPIFLAIGQKRQLYFMAKQELFENPILRWLVTSLGAFPIKRGSADTKSVNRALEVLETDHLLGIFPEGTRSKDGELLKAKAGAAMIAYKENAPIVPAAIYAKNGKVGFLKRVYVAYGEPITLEELGMTDGGTKGLREASKNIMDKIAELRQYCIDYSEGK